MVLYFVLFSKHMQCRLRPIIDKSNVHSTLIKKVKRLYESMIHKAL